MRKKLVSRTYMKGVLSWEYLVQKKEEENYFLCIKKINKIDKPFTLESKLSETGYRTYVDAGYYIIEYTPLDKFYNGRVYLDENFNEIEYYFDMSKGNGMEDAIPYYDDLYLDLMFEPQYGEIFEVVDEDELKEALDNKEITKEDYDLAYRTMRELMEEIRQKKNVLVNLDKKAYIKQFFK